MRRNITASARRRDEPLSVEGPNDPIQEPFGAEPHTVEGVAVHERKARATRKKKKLQRRIRSLEKEHAVCDTGAAAQLYGPPPSP